MRENKNFLNKRRVTALIVLAFGVGLSAYFIFPGSSETNNDKLIILGGGGLNPSLNYTANSYPTLIGGGARTEAAPGTQNLTDGLLSYYAQEIFNKNGGGFQVIDGQPVLTIPSQDETADFWKNYLTQQKMTFRQFRSDDINVDYNTSVQNQKNYLADLQRIYENNFQNLNATVAQLFSELVEKNNPALARNYAQTIKNQIDDLAVLKVPANWKIFHLQYLNLWQKKYEIFEALANLQRDPIKAMVAAQELTNVLEEENVLSVILEEQLKSINS